MLFAGSRDEIASIERAMKVIASLGTDREISDAAQASLIAAHHFVFRAVGELDVDTLAPISPAELAETVEGRENREHAAAFLLVTALVDGKLDEAKIDAVLDYARAMSIDEPYLRDAQAACTHHLDQARADMVRRNLKSITGEWLGDDEDAWLTPYKSAPQPDLERRYESLGALGEATFGRAFFDFYQSNGFAFSGSPDAANELFTTPHDSAHVLSGYDTSLQGELLVSTFTAGMHRDEPVVGHILPVIFSWHLGIELVEFAGAGTGSLDPEKFWVAWERGAELVDDTFASEWEFWDHVSSPLAAVRHTMQVPPLAPEYAADGRYPDWYTPTA